MLEHGERQRAGHQHLGVEFAEIETRPERPLCAGAQFDPDVVNALAEVVAPILVPRREGSMARV